MRDQGQGTIVQRGRNSWRLKFDLGRDPISGKRLTRYVTFRGTKREAQAELTRLLNTKNEGTYIDPTKMNMAEYLDHWLAADVDRRLSAKTASRHRQIVKHQIAPRLGTVPLKALRPTHIEAFEADLQREGYVKGKKKGSGLTAQTVLHVHRTLSQALAHAVKAEVLVRNPAKQVRPPRPAGREIAILTKADVATLLHTAKGSWLDLLVLVAVTTGMRRGELLALRWADVDLVNATLTVNQSLERVRGETTTKAPKTMTSRRTITLPAITVDALKRHQKTQAEASLKLGLGRPELVFTRPDGEAFDPDSVTKGFARLVSAAKVREITLHGLRHTHISHQLMDGVHVKVVSERAGHSNVSVTLEKYAAFVPTMQADAAKGVDAWLRRELAKKPKAVGAKSVPIQPSGKVEPDVSA
jgi:integrase